VQENKQNVESNYFKNTKEWFEIIKWIIIFVSAILPISGLIWFWIRLKPPAEIFVSILLVYSVLTLLLIKPLVEGQSNEQPKD